jgi:hypothetical protein
MKKFAFYSVLLLVLFSVISAAAQDPDWQINFFDDYDDNEFSWPLGNETQGNTSITRVIKDSSYVWTVTTPDPNVSWMSLNIAYPADAGRYRFSSEIRLPDFDPLTCAGLVLDSRENSFYGYVICNDKTYSLFRSENGSIKTLIPYTPVKDYDSFSPFTISAEVNNGWIDLYYNDLSLDTYNTGFTEGAFGLIAMPQSTDETEISFGALSFESSSTPQQTTFDANAVDPNASDNTARMVKMLNMKERIDSTAGTFTTLPEKDMSLAMMGYSTREGFGINARDLLLQTDIAWSSGYERPDYASSGCGFYLRGLDGSTFIEIYAAMDGAVYVNAYRAGALVPLISLKYGTWSIQGSGRLAVAADDKKITILWNDSILGTITDATWMWSGDAGYTVHSGTNGDFGTRCIFTNGEGYLFSGE